MIEEEKSDEAQKCESTNDLINQQFEFVIKKRANSQHSFKKNNTLAQKFINEPKLTHRLDTHDFRKFKSFDQRFKRKVTFSKQVVSSPNNEFLNTNIQKKIEIREEEEDFPFERAEDQNIIEATQLYKRTRTDVRDSKLSSRLVTDT